MFKLEYLILQEEIDRLSNITNIDEFDQEPVDGQILLVFNNELEGFVQKDILVGMEDLCLWFERLNEALFYLKSNELVSVLMPETDTVWYEFYKKDDSIIVSKVLGKKHKVLLVDVKPEPIHKIKILWKEIIAIEEFFNEILKKTESFLNEIRSINNLLVNSNEFKKLNNIKNKVIAMNKL